MPDFITSDNFFEFHQDFQNIINIFFMLSRFIRISAGFLDCCHNFQSFRIWKCWPDFQNIAPTFRISPRFSEFHSDFQKFLNFSKCSPFVENFYQIFRMFSRISESYSDFQNFNQIFRTSPRFSELICSNQSINLTKTNPAIIRSQARFS